MNYDLRLETRGEREKICKNKLKGDGGDVEEEESKRKVIFGDLSKKTGFWRGDCKSFDPYFPLSQKGCVDVVWK